MIPCPEHPMVLARSVKDPAFISDLSSPLKSLIHAFEAVCCVPKCHGPSFSTHCPNHFLSTQLTENPPVFVTVSGPSCTLKLSLRREGEAKRPALRLEKLLPLQGWYYPALSVLLVRILPASTPASSTICPEAQESSVT